MKALANGQARAVNEQGKHVGPVYDELWQRRDGLAVARVDQHYGYVDGQGKLAIPATYARASTFQDQRAVASTDAASLLIDTRGDMLASVGMECGMRTLRNARGQRLWPLSLPPRCPAEPTGNKATAAGVFSPPLLHSLLAAERSPDRELPSSSLRLFSISCLID